jgi:hypothetical protein
MGDMATYHIKEFEKNTRALPDTIIMFRDGVSESVSGSFFSPLFCFGADPSWSLGLSNTPRSSSLNARPSSKPLPRSRKGTSPSLPVRRAPMMTLSHIRSSRCMWMSSYHLRQETLDAFLRREPRRQRQVWKPGNYNSSESTVSAELLILETGFASYSLQVLLSTRSSLTPTPLTSTFKPMRVSLVQ